MSDDDGLAGRWEESGGFNPRFALTRLIKTQVRGLRLQGHEDGEIRAFLMNNLVVGSRGQSVESRRELVTLVGRALDEAFLEGPSDEAEVKRGAAGALPILEVFGVDTEGLRDLVEPPEGDL